MTTLEDVIGSNVMNSAVYKSRHEVVVAESKKLLNIDYNGPLSGVDKRKFKENFGVQLHVCVALWHLLKLHGTEPKMKCQHMLWTLMWLKDYSTEYSLCVKTKVSPKTLRKWTTTVIYEISALDSLLVSPNLLVIADLLFKWNYVLKLLT